MHAGGSEPAHTQKTCLPAWWPEQNGTAPIFKTKWAFSGPMGAHVALAELLVENGLYTGALLVAQTLDAADPVVAHIAARALLGLGHGHRVHALLEATPGLLTYHELALAYVRAGRDCPSVPVHMLPPRPSCTPLVSASLLNLFSALNKKEQVRKRFLVRAFHEDPRNIEALALLRGEALCTPCEIDALILGSDKLGGEGYGGFLQSLFAPPKGRNPLCPLSVYISAAALYEAGAHDELLRLAVCAAEGFPASEATHETMGLYYMARNRPREARCSFLRAIELNHHGGSAYLFCGVAQALLRETEKAVTMLGMANAIMGSSHRPAYFLAYEFQQMNNFPKARHYYTRCLSAILGPDEAAPGTKRSRVSAQPLSAADQAVVNSAVYCLIYNEDYDEAMRYIDLFNITNLLRVFCLLFTGAVDAARAALPAAAEDPLAEAARGFLLHLADDFAGAAAAYECCLVRQRVSVVEDLMTMALENAAGEGGNHAFDYSNALFDALEYKKRYMCLFK